MAKMAASDMTKALAVHPRRNLSASSGGLGNFRRQELLHGPDLLPFGIFSGPLASRNGPAGELAETVGLAQT